MFSKNEVFDWFILRPVILMLFLFSFNQRSYSVPVNMIYFDGAVNFMHDIRKKLAPSPIRALFTRWNEMHGYNKRHATKGNYPPKEVKSEIFKCSFFRELERCYGIKFPQTGEIYLNQSLRKQFIDFYLRLFQIGMTMLMSAPWLKFLNLVPGKWVTAVQEHLTLYSTCISLCIWCVNDDVENPSTIQVPW